MNLTKLKRSFTVLYSFAFFGICSLFFAFVVFPLAKIFVKKKQRRDYLCTLIHDSWAFFTEFMESTGSIKLNIKNADRDFLYGLKGKVIVANHPSFIDIVLLIGLIPHSLCIVKKVVKKNIVMSNIVTSLYLINDEDNEKLKEDAKSALEQGYNVVIFPSGTRTQEGEDLKLYKGAASIAIHSDAEIIPLHIECDSKFLAKNQKIYDAGEETVNYTISINEKINVSDYKDLNLDEIKLRNLINSIIKELISKKFS